MSAFDPPAHPSPQKDCCPTCGQALPLVADDVERSLWPSNETGLVTDVVPLADRRLTDRLPARVGARAEIRRWGISSGPDLAEGLVDLSVTGIRVRLQRAVRRGEQLDVTLWAPGGDWHFRSMGVVCWCVVGGDGLALAGVRLRRRLTPRDDRALIGRIPAEEPDMPFLIGDRSRDR